MINLTWADIGLGGRGVINTWTDVLARCSPLHGDVRSHLSGSSTIQPLAASEESWHRLFFYFLYMIGAAQVRSVKEIRTKITHLMCEQKPCPKWFSCRRKISGIMWAYRSLTAHEHLRYRYTTITPVTFSSSLKSYSWHPTTICINSSGWKNSCHV